MAEGRRGLVMPEPCRPVDVAGAGDTALLKRGKKRKVSQASKNTEREARAAGTERSRVRRQTDMSRVVRRVQDAWCMEAGGLGRLDTTRAYAFQCNRPSIYVYIHLYI